MINIALTITLIYFVLIGLFIWGFKSVKVHNLKNSTPVTPFSVIIPFRCEAENLPALLTSISALDYPKHLFEIIFVDDDSTDKSVEIITDFINNHSNLPNDHIRVIKNIRHTHAPKKDAITSAIKVSEKEWIITTDADCILPKYWLNSFDDYIQVTNSKCVVGPVAYVVNNSFLSKYQSLDILSLQGATIGGFGLNLPFLSNGANLAYERALFLKLQGFKGNDHIASGDDIFLLEKAFKTYPQNVNYLKCEKAIVKTYPESCWKNYIAQRVRWASKTTAYNHIFGKFTGFVVLIMNALIMALLFLTCIGAVNFKQLLYVWIIKFIVDFYLIYRTTLFFNQKELLNSYWLSFIIYSFFSVYIAFLASFSSYSWKGRTFKS
ncbi:glycosyltransferase family 2 protein [Aestuariivivens sediminis]|uniref:glycosyltransferase family 2 protein n=1 Tax=Aestuariivivens sediminis TaxID=2913557 RepID=UPI001F596C97|nr:glycosyltransferase [Aestuariivivens sediminis]